MSASALSRLRLRLTLPVLRLDQLTATVAGVTTAVAVGAAALVVASRKMEPCQMCGGAGNWGCVICDGEGTQVTGRTRIQCAACVGRGKRICRKCQGSGWKKSRNYIVSLARQEVERRLWKGAVSNLILCLHSDGRDKGRKIRARASAQVLGTRKMMAIRNRIAMRRVYSAKSEHKRLVVNVGISLLMPGEANGAKRLFHHRDWLL